MYIQYTLYMYNVCVHVHVHVYMYNVYTVNNCIYMYIAVQCTVYMYIQLLTLVCIGGAEGYCNHYTLYMYTVVHVVHVHVKCNTCNDIITKCIYSI